MLEVPVLSAKNVKKVYKKEKFLAKVSFTALRGIYLKVLRGESYGIVGESGSGKSTLCRILCGLDRSFGGSVELFGKDIRNYGKELARVVQIVFQNPYSSLNPLMRVGDAVFEGPKIHGLDVSDFVSHMLRRMGFPEEILTRYPHQLSGGERQRIAILRALSMKPKLLIADEPLSALDLSMQAEIMELFKEMKKELGFTLVFVSHDLRVVREMTERVSVMYSGVFVEEGPSQDVLRFPLHPYTFQLVDSFPSSHPSKRKNLSFVEAEEEGETFSENLCPFLPRCKKRSGVCEERFPEWVDFSGRKVLCHNPLTG